MSSEAITRNDLTAILNEVLPPTSSEYRKLLWTNPNPTNDFSAQTINLDLSEYDEVEVEFMSWTTVQDFVSSVKVSIGQSGIAFSSLAMNAIRIFTVSLTGVAFENGSYYPTYNSWSQTQSNASVIPYQIYGIKYERVNPPQAEVADVVIEQGTSGSWTYRKWNSGIYECWVRTGNGSSVTIYFPIAFVEVPRILVTSGSTATASVYGSDDVFTRGTSTTKTDISFQVNVANTNIWADVYVIGKWK